MFRNELQEKVMKKENLKRELLNRNKIQFSDLKKKVYNEYGFCA